MNKRLQIFEQKLSRLYGLTPAEDKGHSRTNFPCILTNSIENTNECHHHHRPNQITCNNLNPRNDDQIQSVYVCLHLIL